MRFDFAVFDTIHAATADALPAQVFCMLALCAGVRWTPAQVVEGYIYKALQHQRNVCSCLHQWHKRMVSHVQQNVH